MATELFKLLGTISVDMVNFNSQIDAAIAKVNDLSTALGNVGGVSTNVNVNTSGSNGTGTEGTPTENSDNNNTPAATPTVTGAGTGAGGWTVMKGIVSNLGTMVVQWAGREVKELWKEGWDYNIEQEKATSKYATLLGIAPEEAETLMDDMKRFAMDTPLGDAETRTVATKLLNSGIAQNELIDTLWMLGDLSLGDSAAMASLGKAYTETKGKTKLYAQEAYQYINAGVPIWQILEEYYASDSYTGINKGLTAGDIAGNLNAKNENGVTVSFEDVDAAFIAATSPGGKYYNAMSNMMDSAFGQEQRIGENTTKIAGKLTEPILGFASKYLYPDLIALQEKALSLMEYDVEKSASDKNTTWFGAVWDDVVAKLPGFDSREGIAKNASTFFEDWANLLSPSKHMTDSVIRDSFMNDDAFQMIVQETLEKERESLEKERTRRRYQNESFGGGWADTIFKTDDGSNDQGGIIGALNTTMQTWTSQIETSVAAAVRDGMSGITITGNVTTGNVVLNEGTLVGAIAPRIDLRLGMLAQRSSRGDA